ncbi:ABC transporter ATP-binding protein [Cohnella sp. CIP 111063]|uniref:ABC transporter ATP-binding protein n=1 Tax=unclassified Cohnella TaxID=2636738 RepID=UPI000B8BE853|nr:MULTISPECIES: ABC transporter ATP-binding protein [unclassified Cohnella]OXS59979.1 ABC transporter ATP-binding protein [Cohnella sp. CIP 111063]PRX72793.1 ABC-2 type transport system ATP-binding protein [Cohnella sp. SGD-V74]
MTTIEAAEPVIQLKNLSKTYGEFTAVDRLNLNIYPGEIFGLLGPNGAGKTTTILMMLGLTEPVSGEAIVCGVDATRNPMQVKRKVGYMPDDVGFYEDRSALDNLVYTARLNRIPEPEAKSRAMTLLERVGLAEAAHKRTGTFSRGMRQRLGLADVLIKNPRVIILDEPTLGIDPEGVRELLALIRDLSRNEGLTVLLSSHHLHQVQQICDRVGLFVQGKLIASGDIDTLSRQLDGSPAYRIELDVSPWSESLLTALRGVEGVTDVQLKDGAEPAEGAQQGAGIVTVAVSGTSDVTAELAQAAISSGASLFGLRPLRYGLDDIYHRYFEGGEKRERLG